MPNHYGSPGLLDPYPPHGWVSPTGSTEGGEFWYEDWNNFLNAGGTVPAPEEAAVPDPTVGVDPIAQARMAELAGGGGHTGNPLGAVAPGVSYDQLGNPQNALGAAQAEGLGGAGTGFGMEAGQFEGMGGQGFGGGMNWAALAPMAIGLLGGGGGGGGGGGPPPPGGITRNPYTSVIDSLRQKGLL